MKNDNLYTFLLKKLSKIRETIIRYFVVLKCKKPRNLLTFMALQFLVFHYNLP